MQFIAYCVLRFARIKGQQGNHGRRRGGRRPLFVFVSVFMFLFFWVVLCWCFAAMARGTWRSWRGSGRQHHETRPAASTRVRLGSTEYSVQRTSSMKSILDLGAGDHGQLWKMSLFCNIAMHTTPYNRLDYAFVCDCGFSGRFGISKSPNVGERHQCEKGVFVLESHRFDSCPDCTEHSHFLLEGMMKQRLVHTWREVG